MNEYVNFSLFILSFVVAGIFWNHIFTPLRKNESFHNYLRATSLFRLLKFVKP